jgi:hypothetical protein
MDRPVSACLKVFWCLWLRHVFLDFGIGNYSFEDDALGRVEFGRHRGR